MANHLQAGGVECGGQGVDTWTVEHSCRSATALLRVAAAAAAT